MKVFCGASSQTFEIMRLVVPLSKMLSTPLSFLITAGGATSACGAAPILGANDIFPVHGAPHLNNPYAPATLLACNSTLQRNYFRYSAILSVTPSRQQQSARAPGKSDRREMTIDSAFPVAPAARDRRLRALFPYPRSSSSLRAQPRF